MDKKQVLIVTSSRLVQRRVTRSIAAMGYPIDVCDFSKESINTWVEKPVSMYIIDADSDGPQILAFLEVLYNKKPDALTLMVSHEPDSTFLLELLQNHNINNIIAKHGKMALVQEPIDEHELIITCYKLLQQDIFGIEKYLPGYGIGVHHERILSSEDKMRSIDSLETFLQRVDCYRGLIHFITTVADELLMNAIFDAPRDISGKAKYAERDRRDPLVLMSNEAVDFRFASDGRYVALSISDSFGELNRDVVIRYLSQGIKGAPAQIEQKRGGAGLGLHMVFQSVTQLVFNIQSKMRTEVVALFYVRGSGTRTFKLSGHSLNIFLLK